MLWPSKRQKLLKALLDALSGAGFVRRGDLLVREANQISQAVGVASTRWGGAGYIELVLYLGEAARAATAEALGGNTSVIAVMRLSEIGADSMDLYRGAEPAVADTARDTLLPFLDATRTARGVEERFTALGLDRDQQLGALFARVGEMEKAATYFRRAIAAFEGSDGAVCRDIVRRTANDLGVDL